MVTGSLSDSRTSGLDEPIPLSGGQVRVIVEFAEAASKPSHDKFLTWLQERHEARSHVPRTRDEVDASLRAERESWDESECDGIWTRARSVTASNANGRSQR